MDSETNFSQIEDYLFLGNDRCAKNLPLLKDAGITHIVSAIGERHHPNEFTYLSRYIKDVDTHDIK